MDIPNFTKIDMKPNQNLTGLVVGLIALGFAEFFCLKFLFWVGLIISVIFLLSVAFTTYFYTINYCFNKIKKHE